MFARLVQTHGHHLKHFRRNFSSQPSENINAMMINKRDDSITNTTDEEVIMQRQIELEIKIAEQEKKLATFEKELNNQNNYHQQITQSHMQTIVILNKKIQDLYASIENQIPTYFAKQLIDAIHHNQPKKIYRILEITNDINVSDENGDSLLHIAMRLQRLNIADLLLDINFDFFNQANKNGLTAIQTIVQTTPCDKSAFEFLYQSLSKYSKSIQEKNKSIDDFLHFDQLYDLAATDVKPWLAMKVMSDAIEECKLSYLTEVRERNLTILKQVLNKTNNTFINTIATDENITALHLVVSAQYIDMIELLLARNANPTIRDSKGKTALDYALTTHNKKITEMIADAYLIYAAKQGSADDVRIAIQAGANIQTVDAQGKTALHYLVLTNNKDALKVLLKEYVTANLDIYTKDNDGKTALEIAHDTHGKLSKKNDSWIETEYYLPQTIGRYKEKFRAPKTLSTSSFALHAPHDAMSTPGENNEDVHELQAKIGR